MNYTEPLLETETVEVGIERLKRTVEIRNSMGGAMYFNMMNDDACELANQLSNRGVDRTILSNILGTNNFR